MIALSIALCLIATGQCVTRRVADVTYPTIEACQTAGEKLTAAIDDYMIEHELRVAGITCAAGPADPAG